MPEKCFYINLEVREMEETVVIAIHFTDGEVLELTVNEKAFDTLPGEITSKSWVEIDDNYINTATIKYFWFYDVREDEEEE
ncbi:hypothetical protein QWJ34_06070 [Saccharibacillus sp. CPCC 101409]|uniref:hypothetical protein n=1 Tax=Saccharibacillus sp. CPCC 101409 TaxID=3058041 RepID=UPI0026723D1D|nr:hypothetical protein [Saccharibacillus sp. CPCC 101409]MDO3409322.1 hypothetical protein [Saccharibacillus sp. CPCC 101409]